MKAIEICIKTGCKNGIPNQLCPYSSEVGCDLNKILADALALLKEDCHNCKLECLLQKYDELKEKYDALLKEQEERIKELELEKGWNESHDMMGKG